jgi:hypothetical protein
MGTFADTTAEIIRSDHPCRCDRIIVDTDAAAIASRVSRPRADTTEIVINEQTIMSAYQTVKERVQQKIQQM